MFDTDIREVKEERNTPVIEEPEYPASDASVTSAEQTSREETAPTPTADAEAALVLEGNEIHITP